MACFRGCGGWRIPNPNQYIPKLCLHIGYLQQFRRPNKNCTTDVFTVCGPDLQNRVHTQQVSDTSTFNYIDHKKIQSWGTFTNLVKMGWREFDLNNRHFFHNFQSHWPLPWVYWPQTQSQYICLIIRTLHSKFEDPRVATVWMPPALSVKRGV